jgi:hypothetical protein
MKLYGLLPALTVKRRSRAAGVYLIATGLTHALTLAWVSIE